MSWSTAARAAAESDGQGRRVLDALLRTPSPVRAAHTIRHAVTSPRERPLVSVIIPCFDYGRFLPESIGSALAQTDVDVQVLVVDDASTDDSAAVAQRYATADHRVRVLRHEVNAGHVRAFNTGFAAATGDLVVRLDADDLLTPGSLARAAAVFEQFPTVGLVYGHPHHFTGARPPAPRAGRTGWTVWNGGDWLERRCRMGTNCITTPEAVVRRSVMQQIGTLNTDLRFAQDMEMWLRVSTVADVAHVDGPDQALHRDHDASMSVTVGAGVLTDLDERLTVFRVLFERTAGPDALRLHHLARRTLAVEALERICHAYDRDRVDDVEVRGLLDFARRAHPDPTSLPSWAPMARRRERGRRRRGGSRTAAPRRVVPAALRRVRGEVQHLRWSATGV